MSITNFMSRQEIERNYEQSDCRDYHLRSSDNLLAIYHINFAGVKGYGELTEDNKTLYQAFIVNYWNAFGLDTRMTMQPIAINFVEDQEFNFEYIDSYDSTPMCATAKRVIQVLTAQGKKKPLHKFINKDFIKKGPLVASTPKKYLRFEYKINGCNEWMHVLGAKEWY